MRAREVEFKSLAQVGSVGRGKSKHRPRNDPDLYGGDYPFVQTGDVKHAAFYLGAFSQTYNERGLAQSKLWPAGTLCITIAANIGDTAILEMPACFPDSILGFQPKSGEADVRYVKYCLDAFKSQIQLISQGTTQDNLSLDKLLKLQFWFPQVKVQEKIAGILSAYDDLIANNQRRIALLETMAEEMYREWFVRLRFPGFAAAAKAKGLPLGWAGQPGSDALKVMGGGTPKTDVPAYWDGDIPLFSPKDADDRFFVTATEQHISEKGVESCSSQLFSVGTIFITARGTVGKLALCGYPMAMNQSCYALAPKNGEEPYFWFLALRAAVAQIKGVSKSGVFDNIVMDTFKVVALLNPGDSLRRSFNGLVKPMFEQVFALQKAQTLLRRQRDTLLPRLISGKLKVDHLDIQFPPSMQNKVTA